MSDLRKWLKIMESVPSVFPDQPSPKRLIKKDATVMVNPSVGGGTGRYMHSTPNGAMIDIKGVARELSEEDFSLPQRDYEDPYQKGNDWFHMSTEPDTPGRMNDKPEFRPGDMVKIADVYGAVIGPGFGVFVGYGTTGEDCIVLFDGKQIVVPVENVAAVLEQDAKNNFDDMDNDGNLSPMSFGSDNVKVEEPAMDQRDEFSKWMSAVEEALSSEGKELAEDTPCMTNECGCGSWDCPTCFPSQDEMPGLNGTLDGIGGVNPEQAIVIGGVDVPGSTPDARQFRDDPFAAPMDIGIDLAQNDIDADMMGLEEVGMFDEDEDAIAAFIAGGGQVQQLPYRNRPRNPGQEFGSKHIGSASGRETSKGALRGRAANISLPDNPSQKPIVGEEENEFIEKPKSGKGVKLGDIIHKTEFRKTGGQNSPMTYGEENLGEGPDDMNFDEPDYDADPMAVRMAQDEMSQIDPDEALDMISTIKYMDSMGLSKSPKSYTEDQMAQMTANQLRKYHAEVMGDVAEATRPTKTRTQDFNLDDMDDILNPGAANLPANVDAPQGFDDEPVDSPAASLPTASASSTASKLRGLTGTEQMRDLMGRMDRSAGATEPDRPPVTDVVVRTANDVPAVVSSAMQASGMQSPEWHLISNLPGMNDRAIRAVGRGVFNLMTTTPVEEIKTIANLGGQGPNTDAEMRAVAGWLRDNAEDLGPSQVDHSRVMPGYNPEAHDYRANGVKFHVVKDQSGVYIYAWPDSTSKRLGGPAAGQGQLGQGGNAPRLRESEEVVMPRPTLFEQLKWDEEINAILAETIVEEELLDESSLSKMLGKQKGGQNLVRWMHNKHKLSNEANLVPAPFSERLLWKEFKANPDNFVIVSATDGVAGVKPYEKFIKDRTEEFRKRGKEYNPAGDSTLPYQIIAFTDDGQQVDPALLRQPTVPGEEPEQRHPDPTVMKARMGKISGKDMQNPNNTFNLLADQIGPLKTVWVASGGVERDKMKTRADRKVEPEVDEMTAITKIFKRVRPVLKTLGAQAISQINNRAKRYIDGGNFEGASKIAASGNKLKQFLATIDTSGDVELRPGSTFTTQIKNAVAKASGSHAGSDEYKDYLKRAASGSAMELKPLLDVLRDNLVSLT